MRDVIRDAAIITMANASKNWAEVKHFLEDYEDTNSEEPEYVRSLLVDLGMISTMWADWDIWDEETRMFKDGQYIWIWT